MTRIQFARYMSTPSGRFARVVAGAALIGAGFFVDGAPGLALAVVGAVPLAAGALNVCFIAPLLHVPFRGGAF